VTTETKTKVVSPRGTDDREQAITLAYEFDHGVLFNHDSPLKEGWLVYDKANGLWRPDKAARIIELTDEAYRSAIHHVVIDPQNSPELRDAIIRSYRPLTTNHGAWGALQALAERHADYKTNSDDWDTDPLLLGTQTGIVQLQSASWLGVEWSKEKRVSMTTAVPYQEDAECPRFLKHMELVQPDPVMRAYLLRVFGYMLTGLTGEQLWWYWYGPTASNGKTQTAAVLRKVMGDYAGTGKRAVFTKNAFQSALDFGSAIHDIRRMRMLDLAELGEAAELNPAMIKDLVEGSAGGIKYRTPYAPRDMTARPPVKLLGHGNSRPDVGDNGNGFWRRTRVIPWTQVIPQADRIEDFADVLVAEEGPGILALLVREARAYIADGLLPEPGSIGEATDEYRATADHFMLWLNDCTIITKIDADRVPASALYRSYEGWCLDHGLRQKIMDGGAFKGRMELVPGVIWKRLNSGSYYFGLTLPGSSE
jgi:putative DNA primase/helicase